MRSVIPGRCEASNPESRGSGSGLSDHPATTEGNGAFYTTTLSRFAARVIPV
jgi:hypothetical protein